MERLTELRKGQWVIPLQQGEDRQWGLCSSGMASTKYLYGDHVDRLAAYEDTGLEPEEVAKMAKEWTTYETILSYVDEIGGVDHLRDLIQAERENPKPLTLDELREMDLGSPPIWDRNLNEWCAVRRSVNGFAVVVYIGGGSRPLEANRFYCHKPKEGSK